MREQEHGITEPSEDSQDPKQDPEGVTFSGLKRRGRLWQSEFPSEAQTSVNKAPLKA